MEQIAGLLADHGLMLVFLNVFMTQIGVPVPAIPTLVVAGAYLGGGHLAAGPMLLTAVAGSLLGDLPWFFAGRRYGYRILNLLCRIAIEPASCIRRTENQLARWGAPSLMLAKFVPGFATVAPPLAGATQVPLHRFLGYSAVGAALWAGAAIALGAVFRTEVENVIGWIQMAGTRAALAVAVLLAAYVGFKWVQRLLFLRVLRMARVSAQELHGMIDGEAPPLVLDARSTSARRADPRRIPGAIAVDLDAPEVTIAAWPSDRDVVVYCT